jgi:hypothetical protein
MWAAFARAHGGGTQPTTKEMITMSDLPTPSGRFLSPADRCDRCGAAAYVMAVLTTGNLLFCAHHGRRYAGTLATTAMLVIDESQQLLAA